MRALFEGFLDLLLPPQCCRCQGWVASRPGEVRALCAICSAALPWLDTDSCVQCQQRRPRPPTARCTPCDRKASRLASCTAAVRYEGEVENWITRLKYPAPGLRGLDPAPLAVARMLARAAAAQAPGARPDLVVPVPLHPLRFVQRGFNPAAIAARDVAKSRDCPFDPALLRRTRDTPSQTGLGRAGRRKNVQGAFEAIRRCEARIWLVDDVVTTGATLEACAEALRRAGVRHVAAVVLARTPDPEQALRLSGKDGLQRPPQSRRVASPDRRVS